MGEVKNAARLLYSTALIDGGFNLDDTQFTKRTFLNVRSSLNVPSDAKIEPFVLPEVEEALPEATPEEPVEAAEGAASEGATAEAEGGVRPRSFDWGNQIEFSGKQSRL